MNPTQTPHQTGPADPSPFRPPLKPRPVLFYLGLALVAAWCLILVVMFVATVYPHPEHDPHRQPAAAAQSK